MRIRILLFLLFCSLTTSFAHSILHLDFESLRTRAVVTLLDGTDASFVKPAVALGRSLKASGLTTPMILLHTDLIEDQEQLKAVGWQLRRIPIVSPPGYSRFDKAFNQLAIFGLEEFDRIIYLDADCIVTQNIEELFKCNAQMCGVLRSSFFNAGVLVASPSRALHQRITEQLMSTLADYPENHPGFLNEFFWNPERCPFFDPNEDVPSKEQLPCARLPNTYNGDLTLFTFRSDRWLFDARTHSESITPKIIQFTFGAKPWHWWTYTLIQQHWMWWRWFSEDQVLDSSGSLLAKILQVCFVLPLPFVPLPEREVDGWTIMAWAVYILVVFFASIFYSIAVFFSPYTDWIVWLASFLLPMDVFFRVFLTGENQRLTRVICFTMFAVATALLMFSPNKLILGLHLNFFIRLAVLIVVFCSIICIFVPCRIIFEYQAQRRNKIALG